VVKATGQSLCCAKLEAGEPVRLPLAAVNLGLLLLQQGDKTGVQELQRIADGADPVAAGAALFNLGVRFEDDGFPQEARKYYNRAVSLRALPFSPRAAVNLGILLSRGGDHDGAKRAWQAAEKMGDPVEAAKAQKLLFDTDSALAGIQDPSILANPDVIAMTNFQAAELALGQGQIDVAKRQYEQVMDSGHPEYAPRAAAHIASIIWIALREEDMAAGAAAAAVMEHLTELGHADLVPRAWLEFGGVMARNGYWEETEAAWLNAAVLAGRESASLAFEASARWALALLSGGSLAAEEALLTKTHSVAADAVKSDVAETAVTAALYIGDGCAKTGRPKEASNAYQSALGLAERFELPDLVKQAQDALERLR
jgi:tetratricopeptide (TPR) repeat protein